jgi:hypothetical protein
MPLEALHDLIDPVADVEQLDAVTTHMRRGRQIAHPEIALILIPDQRDVQATMSHARPPATEDS